MSSMVKQGWRWHRVKYGREWHRSQTRVSGACGAPVRGQGTQNAPPRSDHVCPECARLTGFKRRGQTLRSATAVVRVEITTRDLRDARRAGLDPVQLLGELWRAELERRRPLRPLPTWSRDDEIRVYNAARELLPEWGGKGVPGKVLADATGIARRELTKMLGPSRSIRWGAVVRRGYPADSLLAFASPARERE